LGQEKVDYWMLLKERVIKEVRERRVVGVRTEVVGVGIQVGTEAEGEVLVGATKHLRKLGLVIFPVAHPVLRQDRPSVHAATVYRQIAWIQNQWVDGWCSNIIGYGY